MQWLIDIIVALAKAYTDQAILDAKVIPSGTIILWHSTGGTVPAGWVQCNGLNGTRDLRALFVIGAGGGYPADSTGGSLTHSHGPGSNIAAGANVNRIGSNIPPYRALWYIQKL